MAGRRTRRSWPAWLRASRPAPAQWLLAVLSALLLILAFPDFDFWPLAWVALVPLIVAIVHRRQTSAPQAFVLGWTTGTLFFYGSCWWLTHSVIHYGGIPRWLAFVLLAPLTLVAGLFPGLFALALWRLSTRWGVGRVVLLVPFLWAAQEWARLGVTGQLWNAVGYSQAFHPPLIQAASWGGVYAVGFLITTLNAALAYALISRTLRALMLTALPVAFVSAALYASVTINFIDSALKSQPAAAVVIGVQPNVIPDFSRTLEENEALVNRHLTMSADALREWERARPTQLLRASDQSDEANEAASNGTMNEVAIANLPHVVVWPESPMNFTYARDAQFRETVGEFARTERTAVLFNALEPAPAGGAYNSAVMVDDAGRLVAQYDKIRLLPFGEYVPLPRWLPGTSLVTAIVGEFTPGADYPLMPVGEARAGVFICIESAYPSITRRFTQEGADVLINISNDGYLGRTPVLRQHLANTIFRAVETRRPVLRVTNTGISAHVSPRGEVGGATDSFEPAVRTWLVSRSDGEQTFYTRYGDLFVMLCAAVSVLALLLASIGFRRLKHRRPLVTGEGL